MDAKQILRSSSHYETLSLRPLEFDAAVIKHAYRTHVLVWHPDKNDSPDAHLVFIRISEAFSVLRDPTLKADYDKEMRQNKAVERRATQKTRQEERQSDQQRQRQEFNNRQGYTTKQTAQASSTHFASNAFPSAQRTGFQGRIAKKTPATFRDKERIRAAAAPQNLYAHVKSPIASSSSSSSSYSTDHRHTRAASDSESLADQLNRWKDLWASEQAEDAHRQREQLQKSIAENKTDAGYRPMDAYSVRPNVPTVKQTLEKRRQQQHASVDAEEGRERVGEGGGGDADDIRSSIMSRLRARRSRAKPPHTIPVAQAPFEHRDMLLEGDVFSYARAKEGKVDVSVWISRSHDELLWRLCTSTSHKPDGTIPAHSIFKVSRKKGPANRFGVYHGSLEEPLQFTLGHRTDATVAKWVSGLLAWVADHNARHQLTRHSS
jgi:curved DNA-binding protein CbpA